MKDKVGRLDEALSKLDQSLLFKLTEEARVARNDPIVSRAARTKVGELADNYKKLKEAYNQNQGNAPIATIRTLKATHRRLVVQMGADLKEEVPKGILEALDDHLVTGSSVAMEVPFPSSGSLHSRMWERYGLTPPSSRLRPPGFGSPSSRLGPPGFGRIRNAITKPARSTKPLRTVRPPGGESQLAPCTVPGDRLAGILGNRCFMRPGRPFEPESGSLPGRPAGGIAPGRCRSGVDPPAR